jgi:hypothetical protein
MIKPSSTLITMAWCDLRSLPCARIQYQSHDFSGWSVWSWLSSLLSLYPQGQYQSPHQQTNHRYPNKHNDVMMGRDAVVATCLSAR